jgi:predicted lactoylglutathione lyase
MNSIDTITLEVADLQAARTFYDAAFGAAFTDLPIDLRPSDAPTSGFRGCTISLVVSQPSTVHALVESALAAGATALKSAAKSFWGVGGVIQAPDGTVWKIATSAKKDSGPATTAVDEVVLLLGVSDVKATKAFYVDKGLEVAKSFGSKYVEFAAPASAVKLALYGRKAAAKDAGVPPEGSGSHRIAIRSAAGSFSDPDGFAWESVLSRQDA